MTANPLKVFYSYAHIDEPYRIELEKWLKLFERNGLIDDWSDRQITAGDEWKDEINENMLHSQIIILLVSPDFINSDYCYDIETATAIDLDKKKKASVVPVIIRPCLFRDTKFSYLQALPKDALPVSKWADKDDAWQNVSEGIKKLIGEIKSHENKMDGEERALKNVIMNYDGADNAIDFGGDDFTTNEEVAPVLVKENHKNESITQLIKRFALQKPELYFTSNTLKKWASKQPDFNGFEKFDNPSIASELEQLTAAKFLKANPTKSGDTMYKWND